MLSHCAPLPSGGRKDSDVSRFPWCSSRRFVEANLGDRVFRDDGGIRTDAAEYSRRHLCDSLPRYIDVGDAHARKGYSRTCPSEISRRYRRR